MLFMILHILAHALFADLMKAMGPLLRKFPDVNFWTPLSPSLYPKLGASDLGKSRLYNRKI